MTVTIHVGDCRDTLKALAFDGVRAQTCVTSPPYFGLRDYGNDGQLGLEATPDAYVVALVEVFRCVRDVLADDGTLWLNLGDSYNAGSSGGNGATGGRDKSTLKTQMPPLSTSPIKKGRDSSMGAKQLLGIPWRVAFALQADGWYLRQDIIWHKPNPMPESVTDRCTKAHEYIFLLSKSPRYYFDAEAIKEPAKEWHGQHRPRPSVKKGGFGGKTANAAQPAFRAVTPTRNRRDVWTVATRPYKGAHFATFPPALIEPCILAGSRPGDTVLDPFGGSGTTGMVAKQHGRNAILCELNSEYAKLAEGRCA